MRSEERPRRIARRSYCTRSKGSPWMKLRPSPTARATRLNNPLDVPERHSATVSPRTTHSRKNCSKQLLPVRARCHMLSREDLRQLAEFECRPGQFATSFYFQPTVARDKSHREDGIQAKELVRRTIQELELNHGSQAAIDDLHRILRMVESLHGNHGAAKVVFSNSGQSIWREFDLPPVSFPTRLFVNRRFHLKPLAALFSEYPRLWVAMADRHNARVLAIEFGELREEMSVTNPMPRHGRSDGYAGYDAGHTQRH